MYRSLTTNPRNPNTLQLTSTLDETSNVMKKKGYQERETEIDKRKRDGFSPWLLDKLPEEIVLDIFLRLPVESLSQCKRVLRSWSTLISDPHFINAHLLRASQLQYPDILVLTRSSKKLFRVSHVGSGHESVKSLSLPQDFLSFFVNSCNGLLAFLNYDHKHHKLFVDIWNPYIKKRTKCPSVGDIPQHLHFISPPLLLQNNMEDLPPLSWNYTACGFGYDPILNEYKVVALFVRGWVKFEAVVCTIGSTSWRHIEVPFKPFFSMKFNAVHLNGTIYGFARSAESITGVGSFRIRDEKFAFFACLALSATVSANSSYWFKLNLSMLGGDLCLVDYNSHENVVVWALKKHSGGDEVWTRQYVLTIPDHIYSMQLLYTFDNGEILLKMGRHFSHDKCYYYDPKGNRYREDETLTALLSSEKYPLLSSSTFVHVGSLVSPPPHTG